MNTDRPLSEIFDLIERRHQPSHPGALMRDLCAELEALISRHSAELRDARAIRDPKVPARSESLALRKRP